jgi:hypothetical protein
MVDPVFDLVFVFLAGCPAPRLNVPPTVLQHKG